MQKAQLPALEYVMQRKITARPNASLTMNGQGLPVPDVFSASVTYLKKRNEKCAHTNCFDTHMIPTCMNTQEMMNSLMLYDTLTRHVAFEKHTEIFIEANKDLGLAVVYAYGIFCRSDVPIEMT